MHLLREAMQNDVVMKSLMQAINNGWKSNVNDKDLLKPYIPFKDELLVDGELICKGDRLVIPASLRSSMIKLIHQNYMGREGCLRRAREAIYWPRMNSEINDALSKCDICNSYRPEQQKEELCSVQFPMRPWSVVGMDIF